MLSLLQSTLERLTFRKFRVCTNFWTGRRQHPEPANTLSRSVHSSAAHNSKTELLRNAAFSHLTATDVAAFREILHDAGTDAVVQDEEELRPLNSDWMNTRRGSGRLALRPRTSAHVASLLKYCNDRRLAVVPQGGNTGLVQGSNPVFDEIILCLGKMNRMISFDDVSGILTCEAGCVLQDLQQYLAERGYVMPLDLGAKGSCQIGGNVSTNAGGIRFLRYGSLHGNVLGLEAVLANGTVLDMLSSLRKDNTGYHLKNLFIGAEGTLGVVTAVSMLAFPASKYVDVLWCAVPSFEKVCQLFSATRRCLGETLSAFEFQDRPALDLVLAHQLHLRNPLPESKSDFYVLIEASSNSASNSETLLAFMEEMCSSGTVVDAAKPESLADKTAVWRLREDCAPSLSATKCAVFKYDLSIPLSVFYKLVEDTRQRVAPHASVVAYGHVGDGNLHLNAYAPHSAAEHVRSLLEPFVYEWTARARGSVSAEHGLGLAKPAYLHCSKPAPAIDMMRSVKALFDPHGILNPYKVLPSA